ncbi:MAG: signal peptide peptidase SppA [Helicobacteraceae bacterium]|nr:signal peptide peptidase SppA [Helicobacteraceae bacterium]
MKKIFQIFVIKPLDFIQRYFKTFIFLFIVLLIISSSGTNKNLDANLAKLYLRGPILESDTFLAQVESLKDFPNLRGVLLIIDSPGGGLAASVEIADIIKDLNLRIPVIAYAQGTMASGSYYAGMYAHKIVANRGSMIGSIGVIFSGYNIEELMNKVGVKSQSLKAGEFKEIGTISRAWSENEKLYLQNVLNQQYNMFITDVANARRLNKNDYKSFAEGKIFNSYDALNLGLIDLVGTKNDAVKILQELSGVKNIVWVKQSVIDTYLDKVLSKTISEVFMNLVRMQ